MDKEKKVSNPSYTYLVDNILKKSTQEISQDMIEKMDEELDELIKSVDTDKTKMLEGLLYATEIKRNNQTTGAENIAITIAAVSVIITLITGIASSMNENSMGFIGIMGIVVFGIGIYLLYWNEKRKLKNNKVYVLMQRINKKLKKE